MLCLLYLGTMKENDTRLRLWVTICVISSLKYVRLLSFFEAKKISSLKIILLVEISSRLVLETHVINFLENFYEVEKRSKKLLRLWKKKKNVQNDMKHSNDSKNFWEKRKQVSHL
jgi:hypothetical protein